MNMFPILNNHPFAVEAYFESSIVLTFTVPKNDLQHLIPACLELDTLEEQWAFIAVAMVKTKDLRPKGFPKILGNDFFLIGYRIFVKYYNQSGKRLRGLYILKSETDKNKMAFLGSIFTRYNYTTTAITQTKRDNRILIKSALSDFQVEVETNGGEVLLPQDSPFADWKEARKFAGPLPFTFSYDSKTKEVLIVEGVRNNWTPEPVQVIDYYVSFLNNLNLKEVRLASAFVINNIPYYWKKGVIEKWKR